MADTNLVLIQPDNIFSLMKDVKGYEKYAEPSKITKMFSIYSLLPYTKEHRLTDRKSKLHLLNILRYFSKTLLVVIEEFYLEGVSENLDPQLGDTLCQIRAYQFLILMNKIKKMTFEFKIELYTHYMCFYKKIEKFINDFTEFSELSASMGNKELDSALNAYDFLENNGLVTKVEADLFILLQSYVLSIFVIKNQDGNSVAIDYESFSQLAGMSVNATQRIVKVFQRNLTYLSCDFISDLILDLDELNDERYCFSNLIKIDRMQRYILPCYFVSKVLLKHLLTYHKSTPVLILIREIDKKFYIPILFIYEEKSQCFIKYENLSEEDLSKYCIAIAGFTSTSITENFKRDDFFKKLNMFGFKDIYLANMATHPQFSSVEFEKLSDNPYSVIKKEKVSELLRKDIASPFIENIEKSFDNLEKEFIEKLALGNQIGCSIFYPELLCMSHMFFSSIGEALNRYGTKPIKKQMLLQEKIS